MPDPFIQHSRNILAQETGTIHKPHGGRIRVALAYPNTYWVGMSNLGFQAVYRLLNQRPDTVCERAFLPPPNLQQQSSRTAYPLISLESQTPLHKFDVLAFSVPFEGDYPNILKILELAKIEPAAAQRSTYEPLLIMGGVCSSMNPEPLAPIMDGFVLGEGEEVLSELMDGLQEAGRTGKDRSGLLRYLSFIPGFYAPRYYQPQYNPDATLKEMIPRIKNLKPPVSRKLAKLDAWPTHSCLFTPNTEFSDMFLVELSRGCAHACNFCLLGSGFGPYRPRSLDTISASVLSGLSQGKRIGLMGAAVTDYPYLSKVCRLIRENQGRFSVASLRADRLSVKLLKALKQSGHKTISLAPEAGSQRLRDIIAKGLSEEQILYSVQMIGEQGIPHIKLYFMWGLPDEGYSDIQSIADLAGKVQHIMAAYHPLGRLTLSLSPFVPKPHTIFQWLGMEQSSSLNDKLKYLRQELKPIKSVRLLANSPTSAFYQALFSRGDRRVGEALLLALKAQKSWKSTLKQMQPPVDFFVYRERKITETLPWDLLSAPGQKQKLVKQYERWRDYWRAT
jgi:radical SAM superfamily enzyme YgiQ (UPF0313 family)